MVKQIFLNLPVRDLTVSINFFKQLGFEFNSQFTDENAACLVFNETIFAMLLTHNRFNDFVNREITDNSKTVSGIYSFSVNSREEVDELLSKAIAAGGTSLYPTQDLGFMYCRNFQDPDGHHWEVFHMDMSAMPQQ